MYSISIVDTNYADRIREDYPILKEFNSLDELSKFDLVDGLQEFGKEKDWAIVLLQSPKRYSAFEWFIKTNRKTENEHISLEVWKRRTDSYMSQAIQALSNS